MGRLDACQESQMVDRRKAMLFREIAVPVFASVVIGCLSSYVTASVTLAVLEEKYSNLERDVRNIGVVVEAVKTNQIELAARGQWMISTDESIDLILTNMREMQTKQDADIKHENLLREIGIRHGGPRG